MNQFSSSKRCRECSIIKIHHELIETLHFNLKRIVRCDYISDLRYDPWLSRARKEIARMDLSSYSLFALSDAAEYLYTDKQSFSSSVAAQEYFRKRLRCVC